MTGPTVSGEDVASDQLLQSHSKVARSPPGRYFDHVYISTETPEQTDRRLANVISTARLVVFSDPYVFEEFSNEDFSRRVRSDALAVIRDGSKWSQLIPCDAHDPRELFKVFSFHFEPDADNSGFVGWLASRLKARLGTGVFVVCGQNSADGGIFDYWGCPIQLGEKVVHEVASLVRGAPLPSNRRQNI